MIASWFEKVREVPILDVLCFLGIAFSHNGKDKIRSACFLPGHPGLNKTGTAFSVNTSLNVWYCHGCQVGGGNVELVKQLRGYSTIEAADFIARNAHFETWDEMKSITLEQKASYKQKLTEQTLVHEILTIAAHHFHAALMPDLRQTLLIPQGGFDPKESWKNLYETWGIRDDAIDDNLIGFDDGTLLPMLKSRGYSDADILKSGLFYRNEDGSIGDSVLKNRLTFPYLEMGRVVNFIARSTSKTWPCYTDNPAETLQKSGFHYARYKKLPQYDAKERLYVSECIQQPFFGLEEIRRKKSAVIVEGVTDVILMRMFFQKMKEAGIKEAFQWAVGSFLSNQISHDHVQELAEVAQSKDTMLFLCDSEVSTRGQQGAMNTARKLLEHHTLVLIGNLPLQEGQSKVDPAIWVRDHLDLIQQNPQDVWQMFTRIVRQAQNAIEMMIANAASKLNSEEDASLSFLEKLKEKLVHEIISALSFLSEIQQESYFALLSKAPFHYKIPQLKQLLKIKREESSETRENATHQQDQGQPVTLPGVMPQGWHATANGLYKQLSPHPQDGQFAKVAEAPVAITEQHYDIDTGQYYLKAGFYQCDHWHYRSESREIFMSSRLLPGLAKWGFPTTTENAKQLVVFLSEYEAANRDHIKVSQVVSSCGAKDIHGQKAFVLGRRCIYKDKEETIEFLAPDAGDLQIISALEASGSLDQWMQMLKKCIPYDGVMLALYTAFSSPFLNRLRNKGFTCHVWGRSSIGKTITLMICASIWGDPVRLIQSWNQKEVATERRMALCNEVGIFLDELKQAINKEDVEKMLYSVSNGHGRGRGSLKGQQKTLYWLLNLISTGEMPITYASTDEGGQARVINIRDHLFGAGNRDLVRELELTAKMNYGLAGPYFLQHADENRILKKHQDYLQTISKSAKSDIAYRIGNNLAVLLAIGDEINQIFGISDQNAWNITNNLIQELLQDASTIDRATAALVQTMEWALANEGTFYPNTEFKKDIPGVWKEDEYVAFFPYKIQEILERFGFNCDAILRDWADRDWIKSEGTHRNVKLTICPNKRCRMVVLDLEKIKNFL